GGSLFVQREGSGTPVLLLHAGIADSRSWDALVPLLTEAGHHVIRYDRRGYGRSITQDVPFSDRADALAVLDALGIERAVFVGNSMGGMVAIDTAIESRGRVAAVVAVAAGVSGYGPEPTPAESELFDEMDRLEAGGDADAIAAFDVMVWVNGPGQPAERAPAHVREAVLEMDRGLWDPPRTKGQSTRLEPRAAGRLQELTVPVVALAGELDLTETWTTARYLEEHAPQAHAVLLPGVAHMIGMEMPAELARHILELSRSIPDR
ncbi:MAG TPA: alpha/beta hydrolase, partial [Kineosporiaceae bacterium]|nr:alpha/beta hydrolase [Kineosporiaceae bacterium]